jgi:hypothetical protein
MVGRQFLDENYSFYRNRVILELFSCSNRRKICVLKSVGFFPKPYDTFAIKPAGLGLGSDCMQMQTDAGTSNTVISMEVQVAHTLASASSSLWLCCGGASPCNKRNFIICYDHFCACIHER